MTCIHCHQKIEWCPLMKDYRITESHGRVHDYICPESGDGDHEPEPEDAQ